MSNSTLKESSMSKEEIKNILSENTPLYNDINNLIAEYAEPIKFKVGDIIAHDGRPDYLIIKRNQKSIRVLETEWSKTFHLDDVIDVKFYTNPVNETLSKKIEYMDIEYLDRTGNITHFVMPTYRCMAYIDHFNEIIHVSEIKGHYTGNRVFKIDKMGDEYIPAGNKIKNRIYPYRTFDTKDKEISFISYPWERVTFTNGEGSWQ